MPQNKPKRPVGKVLQNFYQALKINTELADPLWKVGKAEFEDSGESFKLGVWNVFKGNGEDAFFRDYHNFVTQVDICLLQEVLATKHGLRDYIPEGWLGIHGGTYERRDGLREGVLSLSRYGLLEPERILAPHHEPIVKTPKGALLVKMVVGGKVVQFLNLHMPLFRSVRRFSTDLDGILHVLDDDADATIVAGDFNTLGDNYKAVLDGTMEKLGLKHAHIPKDPRSDLAKLDHIYHCHNIQVNRIRVVHKLTSSDHFPLLCHLRLK